MWTAQLKLRGTTWAPTLLLTVGLALGCPRPVEHPDAALRDGGPSTMDAARPADAGPVHDGGSDPDAGADAGQTDGGAPGEPFTVLSLNLHCLNLDGPYGSQGERLGAVAALIVSANVDAVALQEVCDDGVTNALDELMLAIASTGGVAWDAHEVFAHVAWEGTPEEAEESVAVLAPEIGATHDIVYRTQEGLRRAAAVAEIGGIFVASVHLDHQNADARLAQSRETAVSVIRLAAIDRGTPMVPAVVAGDFNTREGTAAHQAMRAAGFEDASNALRASRIDHVFMHRGSGLRVRAAELRFDTPSTEVSDHPGVLVTFERTSPAALTFTRVVASYDPGASTLWIRGSAPPLDWNYGWPMHAVSRGSWELLSTELSGTVELKALIDDTTWEAGENRQVQAGETLMYAPSF